LCLGIRPEHISVAPPNEPDSFEVVVKSVEVLGMENVVGFCLIGDPQGFFRLTTSSELVPRVDEKINISFQPEKVHLIHPKSEKVLI